jgi:hypothetical protein
MNVKGDKDLVKQKLKLMIKNYSYWVTKYYWSNWYKFNVLSLWKRRNTFTTMNSCDQLCLWKVCLNERVL